MRRRMNNLSIKIALAVLVLISIVLISCPPVNEKPFNNIIVVSGVLTLNKWNDILDNIYMNGIPVHLDLSACTAPASGGDILKRTFEDGTDYDPNSVKALNIYNDYIQFNPSLSGRFGKEFIKTIILPDVATMISNASDDIDLETFSDVKNNETSRYAFNHFTNLSTVIGKRISLIGTFAFFNCKSLERAEFPNAIIIMQYAFFNCSSIKKLEFEKLRHIQPSAFENCTSLERAEFHNADVIPQRAFLNCISLTEVSFSKAVKIERDAFRNCINLRIARFLADPGRTTSGHPLQNYINDNTGASGIFSNDTLAFHNNVFRGCVSLETLDVRNAWNVYFGGGALAEIGTSLNLFLFDDDGTRTYGHPQVDWLLGGAPDDDDTNRGVRTLRELKIIAPTVLPLTASQIMYRDHSTIAGYASIRNRINTMYNGNDPDDRWIDYNEPKNPVVKVTVNGRPAASHFDGMTN